MPTLAKKLMFNDGFVYNAKLILIASQLQKLANHNESRIAQITDGEWKYKDFEEDAVLSVTGSVEQHRGFFMGRLGHILVAASSYTVETIPDVPLYGELSRIRNIDEEIYTVGTQGQVYVRTDTGWEHMDKEILGTPELHLEDIGGTAPDDLYVVGQKGDILHYDGQQWRRIDSPTNRPFASIKAVSRDLVYLCGNKGNLYRGNTHGWEYIGEPDFEGDYWSVEEFQGQIYAAHGTGIKVFDGTDLVPVDFALDHPVDCHRLHASDGVLWSFGIDHILFFDGKKWEEVKCPMNV